MAIGPSRRSLPRLRKIRKRRERKRLRSSARELRVEPLEERRLLAVGPQLIGVQPNFGDLLENDDILNVAPRELTFQFNSHQIIDAATLGAIRITRAGLDDQFDVASTRTDFNTDGAVIVEFRALKSGPSGNEIFLLFSKTDRGGAAGPRISVEGNQILVELNANRGNETTAKTLVDAINAHLEASELVEAIQVAGRPEWGIASPDITYSPLNLAGANAASDTSRFNTGTSLEVTFTAVQTGSASNGMTIEVSKSDFGGAASPRIEVADARTIRVELNSNVGNETTAYQLVEAFNANALARALVIASNPVGDPNTNIATPDITYSPLLLSGADDELIEPGYLGVGDSDREVIFRFAETPVDDLYRVDIEGQGPTALRNTEGLAIGDNTDDDVDNGRDFSSQFQLDLGAQVLGVVPQPIMRMGSELWSAKNQIEVYFNDDDLDPVRASDPAFYSLIFTNGTVKPDDDRVYHPIAVQYLPETDRARLIFPGTSLDQLGTDSAGGDGGTFRLRIGTDEQVPSQDDPMAPIPVNLTGTDVSSSFDKAYVLGALTGGQIISSEIEPQVYTLDLPGSSDEPGHRDIAEQIEEHLLGVADPVGGVTTAYYNFRQNYGADLDGNPLTNLMTEEQKDRAREVFEIYGQQLGVQFVETETQGFSIATGDMRAIFTDADIRPGDGVLSAVEFGPGAGEGRLIMDAAEDWYDGFGQPDSPGQPFSWFEEAVKGIAGLLGVDDTFDLPPGTFTGSEPALGFGQPPEAVYPGDYDIAHLQHLYRPDGKDIDLYEFTITEDAGAGLFTAEVVAERRTDSSLLDSVLSLYGQREGQKELISRNDDYFSDDSYIELDLEPGTYYIGISSTGNDQYDPIIEDSGFGGVTQGPYDLRVSFRPRAEASILDLDNQQKQDADSVSQSTALDGDGDGVPGGVYSFWFRVDSDPIIVDSSVAVPGGGQGTPKAPFNNLVDALDAARTGDVVRVVGNGGVDGKLATPGDAVPYEIGFNSTNDPADDGATLEIPKGVTVMIDPGAVLKLRRSQIVVGSSSPSPNPLHDHSGGALQVLGVPRLVDNVSGNLIRDDEGNPVPGSVYFTSLFDESLGQDSEPRIPTTPSPGDWGGLVFRNDIDRAFGRFDYEQQGIFLNYVNYADMRYGGGVVIVESVPQTINPIHATHARPTVTNNTITLSADAAISANPDSFEETSFHSPQYQSVPFTSDYSRVGPDIHGNRLVDNSINGLAVRVRTPAGDELQEMTVSGRWDDTDVVHVVTEPLRVHGNPGGPESRVPSPDVNLVTVETESGGTLPVGDYSYRITFVDGQGNESPPSDATPVVSVAPGEQVRLSRLPAVPDEYDTIRIYRSIKLDYVLVGTLSEQELNQNNRQFVDDLPSDFEFDTGSFRIGESTSWGNLADSTRYDRGQAYLLRILLEDETLGIEEQVFEFVPEEFKDRGGLTSDDPILESEAIFIGRNDNANTIVDKMAQAIEDHLGESRLKAPWGGWVEAVELRQEVGEIGRISLTWVDDPDNPSTTFRQIRAEWDEYTQPTDPPLAPLPLPPRGITEDLDPVVEFLPTSFGQLDERLNGGLVIDPGTVVKLNKAGIETGFGSQLIAEGVDEGRVIFTSLQDDRFGAGGTFVTSDQSELAVGDWSGIYVGHMSRASIDHAVLAYGGGISEVAGTFSAFNVMEVHQAGARLTNSLLEHNAGGAGGQSGPNRVGRVPNADGAIFVRGAQPIIVDNIARDNIGAVINVDVNSLNHRLVTDHGRSTGDVEVEEHRIGNRGPLILGNLLADNDYNGMHVRGGTLTTEGVWDDTDIFHIVDETIYVPDFHTYGGLRLESSSEESLVVKLFGDDAGFTATGRDLDITDRIGGMLHVVGQPGSPVVMTSLLDDTVSAGFDPEGNPVREGTRLQLTGNRLELIEGTAGLGATVVGNVGLSTDGLGTADVGQLQVELPPGSTVERAYLHVVTRNAPALPNTIGFQGGVTPPITWLPNVVDVVNPLTGVMTEDFETGRVDVTNAVVAGVAAQGGTVAGGIFNFDVDETVTGIEGNIEGTSLTVIYSNPALPTQTVIILDGGISGRPQAGEFEFAIPIDPGDPGFVASLAVGIQSSDNSRGTQFSNIDVNQQPLTSAAGGTDDGQPQPGELITVGGVSDSPNNPISSVSQTTADDELYDLKPRFVSGDQRFTLDVANTSGRDSIFLVAMELTGQVTYTPASRGFANDWRSILLDQGTHDRNVEVAVEQESGRATQAKVNETPVKAQHLGHLAPAEMAADDIRRLGFEVLGTISNPSDIDVYSFDAVEGTEVWLDIDRTTHALDTVVELVDSSGQVLAGSNDSMQEAGDPGLLRAAPNVQAYPLAKSPFGLPDLWTTNPRDAGMRVVLPGPAGTTNTYFVLVRSNSPTVDELDGGLTAGAYQLQVRLRETDELPGSTVQMAEIRYPSTGVELRGLPTHSPLTGEAAEIVDAQGNDNNDDLFRDDGTGNIQTTAHDLGNLLNTDRGTLGVAGNIDAFDDVDWYQIQVRYDSIEDENDPSIARHLSAVFDIDYADGLARANTNLWVYDETGRLILVGADSDIPEDRPVDDSSSLDDLSRGSVGALDPFIGPVELPAWGFDANGPGNIDTGKYYVAVSSNAVIPSEMEQYLTPVSSNPLLRLEPVNSVNRIAEDHVGDVGFPTDTPITAELPDVPILFGGDDEVTLFAPSGNEVPDGETFTITTQTGNVTTYEFDLDEQVADGHVQIPVKPAFSAQQVASAIGEAIRANPPASTTSPLESTLIAVPGNEVQDGATFTFADQDGETTYEFYLDRLTDPDADQVPVLVQTDFSAQQVASAIADAIKSDPPAPAAVYDPEETPDYPAVLPLQLGSSTFNVILTDQAPVYPPAVTFSTLGVEVGEHGNVTLREHVVRRTLLTEVKTSAVEGNNDPEPGRRLSVSIPVVRDTVHNATPVVRQQSAPSDTETRVFVSRPATVPFGLEDVTLFVAEPGVRDPNTGIPGQDNRTDLISVDALTGQVENRIGAFDWNVGDLAMLDAAGSAARRGLVAFSIWEPTRQANDTNTGEYIEIDPGSQTALNLGAPVGPGGIQTFNPITQQQADVGVLLNALTFNNSENDPSPSRVRGFAVGDRGDFRTVGDEDYQNLLDEDYQNLLFEFDPDSGDVRPTLATPNFNGPATDRGVRGVLLSTFDFFPATGLDTSVVGVDATTFDPTPPPPNGKTTPNIEHGDFFSVDLGFYGTLEFEFDAGIEFTVDVNVYNPNRPQVILDGGKFAVTDNDPQAHNFEFDTGSVLRLGTPATGTALANYTRYDQAQAYLLQINYGDEQIEFEFVPGAGLRTVKPGAQPIFLDANATRNDVVDAIIGAVEKHLGKGSDMTGGWIKAEELTQKPPVGTARTGRVSLIWVDDPAVPGTTFNRIHAEWTQYTRPGRNLIPLSLPPNGITPHLDPDPPQGAIAVYVEETSSADEIAEAVATAVRRNATNVTGDLQSAGAFGNRLNFQGVKRVDFSGLLDYRTPNPVPTQPPLMIFNPVTHVVLYKERIPFLADDDAETIAQHVHDAFPPPVPPQPVSVVPPVGRRVDLTTGTFNCQAAPPGSPSGTLQCPLKSGAVAPGGSITGIAFVGPQLYAVTDEGGLFRIVEDDYGLVFDPNATASEPNVLDYVDGSQELLTAVNPVGTDVRYQARGIRFSDNGGAADTITITERAGRLDGFLSVGFAALDRLEVLGTQHNDGNYAIAEILEPKPIPNDPSNVEIVVRLTPNDRLSTEDVPSALVTLTRTHEPIRFTGLVAGPQNSEDGQYENLLFGIADDGRIIAFDTLGQPQPVFANGAYHVETGITDARGLAFGNLDDNLWHVSSSRESDPGHGVLSSFDGSRVDEALALNSDVNYSLYFGYENDQQQPQFGTGNFATRTSSNTYDFLGGAHGRLLSNTFSLQGYSAADEPTLYFNYFLDTQDAGNDPNRDTTLLDDEANQRMLDSFRVYISGDDGQWKLLGTNNSDRDAAPDDDMLDEFDLFAGDQPFFRAALFDNTVDWRQARVDLAPYAGQDDLRLRFEFSTAGGMSTGGRNMLYDLNVAGNELRAVPGAELSDGDRFSLNTSTPSVFEFEMGPSIMAPSGAAISDGATFNIDGLTYEFDNDGTVGGAANVIVVPFVGTEAPGELAMAIEQALLDSPPPPIKLALDLEAEPNDTRARAAASELNGTTQTLSGFGEIGDNTDLTEEELDVDMVAFHLDAGDSVTIETDTNPQKLNTYLRLFDANGNELAENDDADSNSGGDSEIRFTAPTRGTYYVGISGNHNSDYDPNDPDEARRLLAKNSNNSTKGSYEYSIIVSDPVGPQRVGSRLNLPNANVITTNGLPPSFVEGRAGVNDPTDPQSSSGVVTHPVRVHARMDDMAVADAIQTALGDHLPKKLEDNIQTALDEHTTRGAAESIKRHNEVVHVVGIGVDDPGPLGLSEAGELFGDRFGAFDVSAGINGQVTNNTPGAQRMWDNQHEGVLIDDIIIGFASRGEMVTGSVTQIPSQSPPPRGFQFVANPAQADMENKLGIDEIDVGPYQLEIRQSSNFGETREDATRLSFALQESFDVNKRFAEGFTLVASGGHHFRDGQTFSISDGTETVTFEFDDLTIPQGAPARGVAEGNQPVTFEPDFSAADIASLIRSVINRIAPQERLDVYAVSADGVMQGKSASDAIDLFGNVIVTIGTPAVGTVGNIPAAESNDRLSTVQVTATSSGGGVENEQQTVELSEAADGGTFTLAFTHAGRAYATADIPFDATKGEVKAALNALLVNLADLLEDLLVDRTDLRAVGQVDVSGDPGGPWTVDFSDVQMEGKQPGSGGVLDPWAARFVESLVMANVDPMTGDGSNLLIDNHRPVVTGIVGGGREGFRATGVIGDNPNVDDLGADVDLFLVKLNKGELITIDVDAAELGSPLDSMLRVFDKHGKALEESDDDLAAGEASLLGSAPSPNRDSYIDFIAPADGAYYIGVSAFGNDQYDPAVEGSGRAGTPGHYEIEIQRPITPSGLRVIQHEGSGDSNLFRDQGQIVIDANTITDAWDFGVSYVPTQHDPVRTAEAPRPGPPRNLGKLNTSSLAPGVTISNNVFAYNFLGGISFQGETVNMGNLGGQPATTNVQPAPVPFGRIVNNTVFGGTEHRKQASQLDIVFMIDYSGSMSDDIDDLRQQISGFDAEMQKARIDANYGLVSLEPEFVLSPTDFNTFLPVLMSFSGAGGENGSWALRETLNDRDPNTTLTFRQGSAIAPILLTDEGDDSTPLAAENDRAIEMALLNEAVVFGIFAAVDPDGGNTQPYFDMVNETGGEHFDILQFRQSADAFFDRFTQAVITGVIRPGSAGISVQNNASPTLLNNIIVAFEAGLNIDSTSASTVVGGTVYQENETDGRVQTASGTWIPVNEDFPLHLGSDSVLFMNPFARNFYPATGSPIIDASIESLEDRFDMEQLKEPHGIGLSPILVSDSDRFGQRRADDPLVAPPPGMGQSVFKDRGAVDRVDDAGPLAALVTPIDNGSRDLDEAVTSVSLLEMTLEQFSVKLSDGGRLIQDQEEQPPLPGIGIDDDTVNSHVITVMEDDRILVEGVDYAFDYNSSTDVIRLTPLAGVWKEDRGYSIQLSNSNRIIISGLSGDDLRDGDSFVLSSAFASDMTFEYDTGYLIFVPQTLALEIPLEGGSAGGVADGDTITVDNVATGGTIVLELDRNGAITDGNTAVDFRADSSQGEIADAIVAALQGAGLNLNPVHAGNGLVHLGVDGSQTLTVAPATSRILKVGEDVGVLDGDTFTADDGSKLVTFEFTTDGGVKRGNTAIPFSLAQTHEQIAVSITLAVKANNLGLDAQNLGDGVIQLGGWINHFVDVSNSHLRDFDFAVDANGDVIVDASGNPQQVTFYPGVQMPFGIKIPTEAGDFHNLVVDGDTFEITDAVGTAVVFEFDDDDQWTPGNKPIPFSDKTATWELANSMVSIIRGAGLGLFPMNIGFGFVVLGGEGLTTDLVKDQTLWNSALTQVGDSGVPGATAIPFSPDESFTSEQVAQVTAQVINDSHLPQVFAELEGETVTVFGPADIAPGSTAISQASTQLHAIRDLAGNPLLHNQGNGETLFSVVMGPPMDFGDAPDQYPTLRKDDGARHQIVSGFSLGNSVEANAEGQPSDDANSETDDDGVEFSAPLIPNRTFNITVTTRGIGTVVPRGVLDAWIDYNADGDWDDFNEHILVNEILTDEVLTNGSITFGDDDGEIDPVPGGAAVGVTYARFRLSAAGGLGPGGASDAGEVEDYRITIERNPWQNYPDRFDVNNNGAASPVDVLLMINWVNDPTKPTDLPRQKPFGAPFLDVNGDGRMTALDILQAINHINSLNAQQGLGEGEAGTFSTLVTADSESGEGESSPSGDSNSLVAVGPSDVLASPLRGIYDTAPLGRSASERSLRTEVENKLDNPPAEHLLARGPVRSSRPMATERNHLEDVLGPQETWLDFVDDVDQALGGDNLHDAVFAEMGV